MNPTRPVLRYHGGKWRLAPWIIENLPPHRVYVEPYGGAMSVLLRKQRSYAEVYNDLDGEIVNVFRVLRCPESAAHLKHLLTLTPFARSEFVESYTEHPNPVEQARRTILRSWLALGSVGATRSARSGMRSHTKKGGQNPAHEWALFPEQVSRFHERLSGVIIEERAALDVMRQHDGPDTLHFVDPPYIGDSRTNNGVYRHEMTDAQHVELARALRDLKGMVVLSGYFNSVYECELADWEYAERKAMADGARPRVEVLWFNPAAVKAKGGLFATKPGGT